MSKKYFIFNFTYTANFVRISLQIKKFPKNWVGPLKHVLNNMIYDGDKGNM